MEIYAITTYVIAEEVLKLLKFQDGPQIVMSDAEVITFAIVSAKFFFGNYKWNKPLIVRQIITPPLCYLQDIYNNNFKKAKIRSLPEPIKFGSFKNLFSPYAWIAEAKKNDWNLAK